MQLGAHVAAYRGLLGRLFSRGSCDRAGEPSFGGLSSDGVESLGVSKAHGRSWESWPRWGQCRRLVGSGLVGLASLIFGAGSPSAAATPGYWVAFNASSPANANRTAVYAERTDGSGTTLLVDNVVGDPVWSPNARWVAYATTDPGPTATRSANTKVTSLLELLDVQTRATRFVANVGPVTNLSGVDELPGANAGGPAWSPDSSRLAFNAPDGSLASVSAQGGGLRRLDPVPMGSNGQPGEHLCQVFAPNGTMVATVTQTTSDGPANSHSVTHSLRVLRSDGTGLVGQVYGVAGGCPTWSPDSQHLAYATTIQYSPTLHNTSLQVTNPTGSSISALTQDGACDGDSAPVWSHDGRRILFGRFISSNNSTVVGQPSCDQSKGGLWTVSPEGSGEVQLHALASNVACAGQQVAEPRQWSSDDRLILYVESTPPYNCADYDTAHVAVVSADGSDAHRVPAPGPNTGLAPNPSLAPVGTTLDAARTPGGPPGGVTVRSPVLHSQTTLPATAVSSSPSTTPGAVGSPEAAPNLSGGESAASPALIGHRSTPHRRGPPLWLLATTGIAVAGAGVLAILLWRRRIRPS